MNYFALSGGGLSIYPLVILLWLTATGASVSAPVCNAKGKVYTSLRDALVDFARSELGAPYAWGGARPSGFDCSGLVQYSFDRIGIEVPRTAAQQRAASTPLGIRQLKPGDVVFFVTNHRQNHVGIYIGGGKFIHAPRTGEDVMTSTLDNPYWRKAFARAGSFFN
jgi:cell wall-associated NlpC family hydrolase